MGDGGDAQAVGRPDGAEDEPACVASDGAFAGVEEPAIEMHGPVKPDGVVEAGGHAAPPGEAVGSGGGGEEGAVGGVGEDGGVDERVVGELAVGSHPESTAGWEAFAGEVGIDDANFDGL